MARTFGIVAISVQIFDALTKINAACVETW